MALDMSMFKKKADDTGAKPDEKLPVMPNPFDKRQQVTTVPVPVQKAGLRYFFCHRPNLGVHVSPRLRIQFKGKYFETGDNTVADYLLEHYGKIVTEITEEQKIDGNTLKG